MRARTPPGSPQPAASVVCEDDRLLLDLPVDAVGASARVEVHRARGVVDAEDAREAVLERDDGRVEDAVGARQVIARDDRVQAQRQSVARLPGGRLSQGIGAAGAGIGVPAREAELPARSPRHPGDRVRRPHVRPLRGPRRRRERRGELDGPALVS